MAGWRADLPIASAFWAWCQQREQDVPCCPPEPLRRASLPCTFEVPWIPLANAVNERVQDLHSLLIAAPLDRASVWLGL